ncbi:MAG: TetR/AcrR family transcriptional regulator, partial [Ilumatobacteraceae bacterium]
MYARWPDNVDVDDVILDAAERCFTDAGVSNTTIEEVAVAADVSRITVYRRIGNRDQLVLLVLLRVTDRFLSTLRPRLMTESSLGEALLLLVRSTTRAVRREDLSLLFASAERGAIGVPIPGVLAPMADRFGGIVAMLADQFPAQLSDGIRPEEAGEWLVRVIVSLATFERIDKPNEEDIDHWIRTFV